MGTCGGSHLYQPLDARAAHRNDHEAQMARVYLSFRIARTIRDQVHTGKVAGLSESGEGISNPTR